jgi:hypothetical protein
MIHFHADEILSRNLQKGKQARTIRVIPLTPLPDLSREGRFKGFRADLS